VITGKLNAYDFVDMVFHTGRGVDGFMSQAASASRFEVGFHDLFTTVTP
jgi:hypothetical protein